METKLARLKKYIRTNFKSQEEFAKAVGLTRSGLHYVLRTAKSNDGDLTQDFLLRLEHRKINIFSKTEFEEKSAVMIQVEGETERIYLDQLVKTQRDLIESQKIIIEALQAQLQLYAPDVGKAGARRTSA